MLIAIAIAEKIQGLQNEKIVRLCKFSLTLARSFSAFLKTSCQSQRKLSNSKLAELLCNPWISSAMAMAIASEGLFVFLFVIQCVFVFVLAFQYDCFGSDISN